MSQNYMLAIPFSLRGHLAMRVNMKYVKAAIVFMHLACAGAIAAQGKIKLIVNKVTGQTMASFEPALDYVVMKIPKWPFDKFREADRRLGTQM